jgi:NTE family protein
MDVFNYRYLVFEGGGVKGVAYAKIPIVLEEFGILKNIKKIAGSSAGAIIATLLALKYNPKEIFQIIKNTNFSKFKDTSPSYLVTIYNLLFKSGVHSGQRFEKWIKTQILYKTGNRETTFRQLFDMTGIELVLTGTCFDTKKTEYFSYKTKPDMPVWLACRISMSIPCYYFPVSIDMVKYVDGGMLYNYPIWVFDNPDSYEFKPHNLNFLNDKTLGFKLISKRKNDFISTLPSILPVLKTFYTLLSIMLNHIELSYIHQTYWDRTIGLDTSDLQTTDFDISEEKKMEIIDDAYMITKKYIQNKQNSLTV